MNIQHTPELDATTLPLKDQQEVNTLQAWVEMDQNTVERSRRLRNMLGGTALAGYGALAAIHYGESVPLSDLTAVSAGLGVLMNSATRKHGDMALNKKMADRSATQVVNIAERAKFDESEEVVELDDHDEELSPAA